MKDCSTEEIASAVRMAVSGETALSPQLAASMLDEVRRLLSGAQGSTRPVSLPILVYKVYPDGREELVRNKRATPRARDKADAEELT